MSSFASFCSLCNFQTLQSTHSVAIAVAVVVRVDVDVVRGDENNSQILIESVCVFLLDAARFLRPYFFLVSQLTVHKLMTNLSN